MDNIVVGVRVRPLNEREKLVPDFSHAWKVDHGCIERTAIANGAREPLSFSYDSIFEPGATNEDVYEKVAAPVVESALGGFNATVFAYGQTSSGKTHTMLGSDSDPGVTQRAIAHVLRVAAASKTRSFLVRASYVEIYNDKINDLSAPARKDLNIREDKAGRVFVEAEEAVIESVDDAMAVLKRGQEGRKVGATKMNAHSSRSHTVFSLLIESKDEVGMDKTFRVSTLNLVDLAGSERLKSTGSAGMRKKEGAHINKSLLTLGTIINKLSKFGNDPAKLGHLPYRESKLTRLLRPALGGNSKTAVLCAVTPSNLHVEETVCTLRFAERAKKITNHASRNEVVDYRTKFKQQAVELAVLQERFAALEAAHKAMKPPAISPTSSVTDMTDPAPDAPGEGDDEGATAPEPVSIAEVVSLRMDMQTATEEIGYLKGHVDEVEAENEHLRAQLRKKGTEHLELRSRTLELRQTARAARQKERETCRALIVAFGQLEEARAQLESSRKKGAHVKLAEATLEELSLSLRSWLPIPHTSAVAVPSPGGKSPASSLALTPASGNKARLAREIGKDVGLGRSLLQQIALAASPRPPTTPGGSSPASSLFYTPDRSSAAGTPGRRPRGRALPEDLVMDIDDDEDEREERTRGRAGDEAGEGDAEATAAAAAAVRMLSPPPPLGTPEPGLRDALGDTTNTPCASSDKLDDAEISAADADGEGVDADAADRPKGWRAFKQFYGYGYTRGSVYDEIVGGHRVPSSSKHVSA